MLVFRTVVRPTTVSIPHNIQSSIQNSKIIGSLCVHSKLWPHHSYLGGDSQFSLLSSHRNSSDLSSIENSSPQGIQGDTHDSHHKLWLESCKRYGVVSCEAPQGIQAGVKNNKAYEVSADLEQVIADVQKHYISRQSRADSVQGIQEGVSAFPDIDSPCPQGVQGDDCVQFKLWLENCYRLGIQDCMHQYHHFKAGRKTLQQIFAEQEYAIYHSAARSRIGQRRYYSTSTASSAKRTQNGTNITSPPNPYGYLDHGTPPKEFKDEWYGYDPFKTSEKESTGVETQRQKLKRVVKEYGSTVIVFHVGISLMSLGFFYTLVSSGLDVLYILQTIGIPIESKLAEGASTFVIAYAVHKVFAPARIATTVTATPFIVRYLRRIGFLKSRPPVK